MQHLQSALGIFALLAFAFLISENRRAVDWKSVGIAFAVTVATAVLLLEVPAAQGRVRASSAAPRMRSAAPPAPAPRWCSAISAAARCRST